ncbi:MAG: ABC transporter substrate-binding protein [Clostridiales bacterium]|nr:ABC transporter substrate-binding protein [Clostridiales bacterium]
MKIKAALPLALCLALCACALGSASAASPSEPVLIVGFSQVGAESDWRAANTKSMQDTFTEDNGYKLIFHDAQQKQENQINVVRGFVQQEVDYIVLAPVTESGWATVLQEAEDADIPVILVDRMIDVLDYSLFTCWVGSDFRKESDIAVEWMRENLGTDLKIVHLQGTIGSSAQIGRTEGLEAGLLENPSWKLVSQQTGEFTEAKGQEIVEALLESGEDINVVFAENDNMAFGAIAAIEAAGKTAGVGGDIAVISFDATSAGLQLTLERKINFNVECNPLHGPRVDAIIKNLEGGMKPEKLTYVSEQAFDATTLTQAMLDDRLY